MEKQLSREEIYNGKVIRVAKDEVLIDDGSHAVREVVLHNGGASIALKKDGRYFMVRQYRYVLGKQMLEFPAGKIEIGEDPDSTILREAQEEAGYTVRNLKKLGSIIPTCGYCTERIHLYYGEAGERVGQHFDADERIDLKLYSLSEIKEMILTGEIDDAKTVAIVYHLEAQGIDA